MQLTAVFELGPLTRDALENEIDQGRSAANEISLALRPILADAFADYVKAKNYRWHMSGRHFRDHYLFLDQADEEIFTMTDDVAEPLTRSLRSIHEICERHNDAATAGLVEKWIGEIERRTWFPFEIKEGM